MAIPYRQKTSAEFIDDLLVGYDRYVHPNYYTKIPTNVSINIFINSIDSGPNFNESKSQIIAMRHLF